MRPGISFIQTKKTQNKKKKTPNALAVAKNGQRLARRARRLAPLTCLLPLSSQTGAYDAKSALRRHRPALFRGLYFPKAICRLPSGGGCQARISLINELLLKFHKSNSITQFPHAPSALMECRNVSFSHASVSGQTSQHMDISSCSWILLSAGAGCVSKGSVEPHFLQNVAVYCSSDHLNQ